MARTYNSTFTTHGWMETDIEGAPGALRRSAVTYGVTYIGDVAGTSSLSYILVYKPDQTVDYVGYEAFDGTIGALSGSIVFELRGTYNADGATIEMKAVPGTATGDLVDRALTGTAFAPPNGDGSVLLVEKGC